MKIRQTLNRLTAWLLCLVMLVGQPVSAGAAFQLPASLKLLEEDAFLSDERITGLIVLSDNLESVGTNALSGTGLYALEVPAKTLTVADQGLDSYAYLYVHGSDTALIENDVAAAKYVFAPSGSRVQTLCSANGYTFVDSASLVLFDGFYYQVTGGQAALLCAYDATTLPASVTIPETLSGANVTEIRENAFFGCGALTNVSLPWNAWVADGALSGCPKANVTYYGEPQVPSFGASIALLTDNTTDFYTGMTAQWSVSVVGGASPYKIKFDVYCDDTLLTSGSYSDATDFSYTFPAAGAYHVVASVRDSEYNVVTVQSESIAVSLLNVKIGSVTHDCQTTSPLRGTSVTWTVTPQAGLAPFEYGFTLTRDGVNYATQTYSQENTFTATLSDAGSYALTVRMKDANNTVDVFKTSSLVVLPPQIQSITTNTENFSLFYTEEEVVWTVHLSDVLDPYICTIKLMEDDTTLESVVGTSLSYTFTKLGSYNFSAEITDPDGQLVGSYSYYPGVSLRPIEITDIVASPGEAIRMGDSVDFTVTLSDFLGQYSLVYEMTDTAAETVVATAERTAPDTPFTYTFPKGGEHQLDVYAIFHSEGVEHTLNHTAKSYTVGYYPIVIDSLNSDALENAAQTGDTITWTVQPSGGDLQYEYLYILWRDDEEVDFRAYSSENTYAYTPTDAGSYVLEARVRDGQSTVVTGTSNAVTVTQRPLEIADFTADEDIYLGSTAHFTLTATGGRLPLTYSFEALDAQENLLALQAFSTNTAFEFTPEEAGVYTINTTVRDSVGTTLMRSAALTVSNAFTTLSLSGDRTTLYVDETVTFTAETEGGKLPLTYAFHAYDAEGAAIAAQEGEENTFSFAPDTAGEYTVTANVHDALGMSLAASAKAAVYDVLTLTELSASSTTVLLDTQETFTLVAKGGKAPLSYAFDVLDAEGVSVAQQSGEESAFVFTGDTLGDYTITASVTDALGTTLSQTLPVIVYEELKNVVIKTDSPTHIYTGESASFSMTNVGGLPPFTYEFFVKNEAGEIVAEQLPGTESTFSVTLDTAGEYIVTGKINGYASAYPLHVFDPLTDAQLAADEPSVRHDETAQFLFRSVTGGMEPFSFSFSAANAAGETIASQAFSSENAFSFSPNALGDYTITATVRDARENTLSTTCTLHVYEQMLLSDLASDVTETRAGCNVTWSVVRTEGHDTAMYTWNVLRDGAVESTCYTDVPELVYAPQEMGAYTVEVTADDGLETVTVSGASVSVLHAYTPLSDFGFATYFGAYGITGYKGTDDHIVIPPTDASGKTITAIHVNAFVNNQSIVTVELPDTITYLGMSAFGSCSNLKNINLPPKWNNTEFSAESANITTGPFAGTAIEHITVPSTMTFIPKAAFGGMKNLKSVTLHDGITSIGNFAFNYCSSLTDITLPESITALGARTFSGCTSLTSINYPAKLERIYVGISGSRYEYIYEGPFSGSGITSITVPEGVTALPGYIFSDMPSVKTLLLPSTLTSIGTDAFDNCPALEEITLASGNTSFVIHDGALMDAAKTKIFCYPKARAGSFSMPETLTSITAEQFKDCVKLESVTLHDSVTDIGNDAFMGCTSLTSINIPAGVTAIYPNTFKNCAALKNITLSPALTSIYSNAFENCNSLTQLVIPSSVTDIRDNVFKNCPNLTIYCVHNSAAYTYAIKYGIAYIATASPADFDYTGSSNSSGSFCTIDRYVGSASFVIIPETIDGMKVTAIGDDAFSSNTTVTEIYIPEGVKTIGANAFANCTSLKLLHIPATANSFKTSALTGTPSDLILYGPASGTAYSFAGATGRVFLPCTITDNACTIVEGGYYLFPDQTLTIPAKLAGYPVTAIDANVCRTDYHEFTMSGVVIPEGVKTIGEYAFYSCTTLKNVTLPDSVTSIGTKAFGGCTALTEITLPANWAQVTSSAAGYIRSGPFANTNITHVDIPAGMTAIPNAAFAEMQKLTSVTMHDAVESIGDFAFCFTALKSINLPEGCTELGRASFAGTALTEIILPHGVPAVPHSAFSGCSALKKVTLPESVTSIDDNAFDMCYALEQINIPAGVTYIGDYAFQLCSALNLSLVIPENATLGDHPFIDCGENLVLYVAKDSPALTYAQNNSIPYVMYAIDAQTQTAGIYAVDTPASMTEIALPNSICGYPVTQVAPGLFQNRQTLKSVTLPSGLTAIPNELFSGCSALTDVNIPESVTRIGNYAFKNCTTLKTVTIPDSVTSIGDFAFMGCSVLTEIDLPDSVTSIGQYAFYNCAALKSATLPSGLTELPDDIFDGCSALTEITIPAGVMSIPDCAFYLCTSLKKVTLPEGLTSIGYSAFEECPLETIDIPDSVETIGSYAFYACGLETLTLPASLTTIGDYAFQSNDLTEITIPETVTTIGEYAFDDNNLTTVIIPSSGTLIGTDAFANCSSDLVIYCEEDSAAQTYAQEDNVPYILYRLDQNALTASIIASSGAMTDVVIPVSIAGYPVTEISDSAFQNNTTLTSIVIPEGVTRIGIDAFNGCTALETIDLPDSLETIGVYAFYQSGLTSVALPKSLTRLPSSVFDDCDSLTTVTFEGDVTSIGTYAFSNCNTLTTITLPETVTSIGQGAFRDCTQLPTINIPAGVTEIANETFYECKSLGEITIPDGVTTIGEVAFWRSGIPAITLPNTVTSIGDLAFEECANLTYALIPASVTDIGYNVFMNASQDLVIYCEEGSEAYNHAVDNSIDYCVYAIAPEAQTATFCGDPAASGDYIVPATLGGYPVTAIADCAFESNTLITSVTLPDTLTNIGANAFKDCTGLSDVFIPEGVTSIGDDAFDGIDTLTLYVLEYSAAHTYATENSITCRTYFINYDAKTITFPGDPSASGEYVIPETFLGYTVVGISAFAFQDNAALTGITMPDTVTRIEQNAFTGCTSLASVDFSDTLDFIGWEAFKDCTALTKIVLPESLTQLAGAALSDCTNLSSINLPESLSTIQRLTFQNCTSLTAIDIPETITTIDVAAFSGCTGFTSITLPESLATIGMSAFWNCTALESINIPNAVTSIGDNAFSSCTALKSIVIPEGVTEIADMCFYGCSVLESVSLPSTLTSINFCAFDSCMALSSIDIPDSVTFIGQSAFSSCESLTAIELPKSLKTIDYAAFIQCPFTEITFSASLETIGEMAFGYNNFTQLTIPGNVKTLGNHAFYGNYELESVVIEDGVETLGTNVFWNCGKLTSVTIPDSVTIIGDKCFEGCPSDLTIYCSEGSAAQTHAIENNILYNTTRASDFTYTIANGECTINRYGGSSKNIIIPATIEGAPVTALGYNVFAGNTTLESVIVPDSVTSVGYYTFANCPALQFVYLPAGITYDYELAPFRDGKYPFEGCSSKLTVYGPYDATLSEMISWYGDTYFPFVPVDGGVEIVDGASVYSHYTYTTLSIPAKLGKYQVVSIGDNAFSEALTYIKNIVVPDGVTSIGYEAFYRNDALESVTISDTVSSIGQRAFGYCSALKTAKLPRYLSEISAYLFQSCAALESVTMPENVYSIGNYAFSSCSKLTDITLPNTLETIGAYAFCLTGLKNVLLPDSVTSIGNYAFSDEVYVAEGSAAHTACQSATDLLTIVYRLDEATQAAAIVDCIRTSTNPAITCSVTLPDTIVGYPVTEIADYAFDGCDFLASVVIPDSVTNVGGFALRNCTALTSVTLPANMTAVLPGLFYGCSKLTSVTLPESIVSIGSFAFTGTSITTLDLPETVTTLEPWAFDGLSTLTSISLPEGLTTIGASAFQGCAELTEITLPQTLTSLGSSAFSHCTSLTGIVLPDTLTSISDFTFNSCMSLASVTLPANVISIGESAFLSCPITSLAFPDTLETIGNSAFLNSTCASVFVIPTSVTYIGDGAFDSTAIIHCEENSAAHTYAVNNSIPFVLFSVDTTTGEATFVSDANASGEYVAPAFYGSHPVKAIGNYAFENNKTITAVTIPEGVTTIGTSAFYNCTALESISLPQTLTTLKTDVFDSCKALKSIVIPEGVTTLPGMCFRLCTSLTDVTLPASLTTILPSAFASCGSLTSLTLPSSITDIRDEAITSCSNLTIYCEENSAAHTYAVNNRIPFVLFSVDTATGEAALVSGAGASGDYVVPAQYGAYPVTAVRSYAFRANTAITSVTISEGVTNVGTGAFMDCTALTQATLPKNLTAVGGLLFNRCTSLSAVTLPEALTRISDFAFEGCSSLKSLTIPASVTSIGSYAFNNCTALTALHIRATVETIGENAFDGCTNLKLIFVAGSAASTYVSADPVPYLAYRVDEQAQTAAFCSDTTASGSYVVPTTFEGYPVTEIAPCAFQGNTVVTSITLPKTVTSIGDFAFEGCTALASVNIPDGVTTLGNHAFTNCDALTTLTLPDSLTSIDSYAFSSCSALKSINLPANLTQLSDGLFSSCTQLAAITIPETVTSIGSYAFYTCTSLATAVIPPSVTNINENAFDGCSSNLTMYCEEGSAAYIYAGAHSFNVKLIVSGLTYTLSDTACTITGYLGSSPDVVIPESIGGLPVTTLAASSFKCNPKIQSVSIPSSVTTIELDAFYQCSRLERVNIPASVTSFGDFAFMECTKLTDVTFEEGRTELNANYLFHSCDALTEIKLPESLTTLSGYVFGNAIALERIYIPESVQKIGTHVFSGCPTTMTIHCVSGSTAHTFAEEKEYGVSFTTF